MHPHLAPAFQKLKKSLFTLSAAVEENLHCAVAAAMSCDPDAALAVRSRDHAIDLMEVDFEEECLKILALYQPVAIDLRFVVAVLKINNDLERIGDLAVNIADLTHSISCKDSVDRAARLTKIAEMAQTMVKKSLDAVVNMDAGLAREVLATDDEVDRIYHELISRIRQEMREDGSRIDDLMPVMLMAKHIERVADHATNIAEDAVYLVDGDIVRHGRHHGPHEE